MTTNLGSLRVVSLRKISELYHLLIERANKQCVIVHAERRNVIGTIGSTNMGKAILSR